MSTRYYDLLIVDDNVGIRSLLIKVFSDEGFIVEVASSGIEALQKIHNGIPLLVILDVKMPGMNGIDTLKEVIKFAPNVPVILMTAYAELISHNEKGSKQVKVIEKPFDLDKLRSLVKEVLKACANECAYFAATPLTLSISTARSRRSRCRIIARKVWQIKSGTTA